MVCKEYEEDKTLEAQRTKELGSLEYQCKTCVKEPKKKCHFLKMAKTHFSVCKDWERK